MAENDEIFFPADDGEPVEDTEVSGEEEIAQKDAAEVETDDIDEEEDEEEGVQDDPSSDRELLEARYMSLYA